MAGEKAVLANKPRNLIPMDTIQAEKYTIQNELRFVKGTGSHVRNKGFYLGSSRLKILNSYRRSPDKRGVWGDLDKEETLR